MEILEIVITLVSLLLTIPLAYLIMSTLSIFIELMRDKDMFGDTLKDRFILKCSPKVLTAIIILSYVSLIL